MISIFDYGAGNLQSVQNALKAIGAPHEIIRDAESVRSSSSLILPGVGNFGQMMRALDQLKVRDSLRERIVNGRPFLGICLGLQALFESSAEAGDSHGLAIFPGHIQRLPGTARIPHMGWNNVAARPSSRLFRSLPPDEYFYFAHSYFVELHPETVATCDYGVTFSAMIERDNIFGVQFHPEKSGPAGLAVLERFVELSKN